MYPLYPFQNTPYLQQQVQNIQYVNGKQSAESYQLPANSSVILMDSNCARFYMKKTDASGLATIKAYDFKEVEDEKPQEYVTKAEFDKFKASMKGVKHESTNDARKSQ